MDKNRQTSVFSAITDRLQLLVFVFWAYAFIWLFEGNNLQSFLQPKLWPIITIGAVIMVMFLIATLGAKKSSGYSGGNSYEQWARAAILVLPLLFVFTSAGKSLGADALKLKATEGAIFGSSGSGKAGMHMPSEKGNPGEPSKLSLLALSYNYKHYIDKEIIIEGNFFTDDQAPAGHFYVYRFAILCCMSDARPISLLVEGIADEAWEVDDYLEVQGTFVLKKHDGETRPFLIAKSVKPIPDNKASDEYMFY